MSQKVGDNPSGLAPVGRAVLVEAYEPEIKRGSIVIPQNVSERTIAAEMRAVVLAVGPLAWGEEPEPRAQVGDKVLIARYAGVIAKSPVNGKLYRIVNANDIFARIEAEEMPAEVGMAA